MSWIGRGLGVLGKWLAATCLLFLLLTGIALAMALEIRPAFVASAPVSPAVWKDVVNSLRAAWPSQAPNATRAGPQLAFAATTLDALASDASHRRLGAAGAKVQLEPDRMTVGVSLPLAALVGTQAVLPPMWLNVRTIWTGQAEGLPVLSRLGVGSLDMPVPAWLREALLRQVLQHKPAWRRMLALTQAVRAVNLEPHQLSVRLHAPRELAERLRERALPGVDLGHLQRYHAGLQRVLVDSGASAAAGGTRPLSTLLRPMWLLAQQEAAAQGAAPGVLPSPGDLSREFRLSLLSIALYAFQVDPALFAPEMSWPQLPPSTVVLRGRADHALHYIGSALLAMGGGTALADLMGLYKELADGGTAQGSGFSFDDLAADRAGAELGQRVAREPLALLRHLPVMTDDAFLMPVTGDLPTGLSASAFAARFGREGSADYQRVLADIERRVAQSPILR